MKRKNNFENEIVAVKNVMVIFVATIDSSVVLVWLHIIRFSFSKKANEEQSLILVLVSQLKRKKGY